MMKYVEDYSVSTLIVKDLSRPMMSALSQSMIMWTAPKERMILPFSKMCSRTKVVSVGYEKSTRSPVTMRGVGIRLLAAKTNWQAKAKRNKPKSAEG